VGILAKTLVPDPDVDLIAYLSPFTLIASIFFVLFGASCSLGRPLISLYFFIHQYSPRSPTRLLVLIIFRFFNSFNIYGYSEITSSSLNFVISDSLIFIPKFFVINEWR